MRFSLVLLLCAGCGACDDAGVAVDGPHAHIRCAQLEADERTFEASGLRAEITEHAVAFEGGEILADVFAVDVDGVDASTLEALGDTELQIVMGGFATRAAGSAELLRSLAARAPTLLLMGGEDDTEVLDDALDELDSLPLIDLRGVRTLSFAGHPYAVVAGSPAGRYTLGDTGCGFDEEDLDDLAEAGEGASLLSWAMPRGAAGGADVVAGVSAGDPWLARLIEANGFVGGLHAWPREHAGVFTEGVGVVPVLGRTLRREDGSPTPSSVLRVRLTASGPEPLTPPTAVDDETTPDETGE